MYVEGKKENRYYCKTTTIIWIFVIENL